MDEGSTARVSFGFIKKDGGEGVTASTVSANQVILANPIQVSYTANKGDGNATLPIGQVTFSEKKTQKDEDGRVTAYAFEATPDKANGYMLDGALKATWKNASGAEQSKELTEKDGWLRPARAAWASPAPSP